MSGVPSVIQATTLAHVQTYYCTHTRSNRSNIEATVKRLLGDSADQPLRRLPEHGDLAIPRPVRSGGPKFWVVRLSGQLSQGDQDTILEAARKSESAGCQAFIKGTERTAGLSPHHLGVFFRASEIHTPWVTNDTLQPHSNKRVAAARRRCMLGLCLAIDAVVKEKVQSGLDRVDRKTRRAHKASCDRFKSAVNQGKLDLRGLSPSDFQDVQVDHVADFFRLSSSGPGPRSGQDTCPRCNKTYKDLLDHIKKKHGEDRFTAEEMADTGLWVCSCGKVAASERGLSYHRNRYHSHQV
ncbi:hypothetical protein V865_006351 [Kwoniella europaea PYCC6329]|uniref:C2H2-type domain-containing protein n=1 Tax=Kwoniella europaea PYCC6329 TaxID=1423913 RepID=A0AAX4KP50_9TREE